ncbi:MAG TPA: preprotein translocase subunit YajC [Vicinamibacterales bacterium]|nr:preprotein translocase subunit YajC [Vicinamibacterales bacterium]
MTDLTPPTLILAMAQPGPGQPSLWVQLFPFALMLLVFYVLVLLPMRRRQRKVQEFQAGLKVGDKVIMTAGIQGQITRVSENSVQLQIADKVRIEVARAAIGGYQGQEPVVQPSGNL